jgi:NosR/NirI family nitrous oxide reductase transcriptional regulator
MASRRLVAFVVLAAAGATLAVAGQAAIDPKLEAQLRVLFPAASGFTPKGGTPPAFSAYAIDPATGTRTVTGFAFYTTELAPLERGYDGPIKILVGLGSNGVLTGVIVVDHHEPYGYFSVDLPEFSAQFKGKSIRDPFRVGSDVDAISRASLTVGSSVRAIRDSARRVASQLLTPPTRKR